MHATVIGDQSATSTHGELQKIFGASLEWKLLLETKLEKKCGEFQVMIAIAGFFKETW